MFSRKSSTRYGAILLLVGLGGCAWSAAGETGCQPSGPPLPLPEALHESSGVARSRIHPGVVWSHNDGVEPTLFALDDGGGLLARIPISGVSLWDWEDLSIGECPAGSCLYLADTGDNAEVRPRAQLIRVAEPDSLDPLHPLPAEVFPIQFPDGPRDVEAVFVLPEERVYFISKGRSDPLTLYRYPPPLRPGEVVTLEAVQDLSDGSMSIPAQVTGADASPDGELVVVRSYEALRFFRLQDEGLVPVEGGRVVLRTLREPQGEGVAFGSGGELLLTTEAGNFGGRAALRVLACPTPIGG